jgi:hypothetical protein
MLDVHEFVFLNKWRSTKGGFIMKKFTLAILGALIVGVPGFTSAADMDLPVPMQQYQQIRYYSGGVSVDERREFPQLYALKITFSTDSGYLLCGAEVTVSSGGKTVFRGSAQNGPWLIVDLPPGVYDIEAVQDGKARSVRGVSITAGMKRTIAFKWKTSEVNMGL